MAFKSRQEETKPAESRTWAKKEEPPKETKPAYDGPTLITGLLEGKKATAWGKTYKAVDVETDKGNFTIPEGVTFLVLENRGKGKNPYNLFIARNELKK